MTNIRPDRDLNLVPPGYKPQSIRMSHRVSLISIRNLNIRINFFDMAWGVPRDGL